MKAVVAVTFFLLLSCGSKTAVPKEIIPVDKMTGVFWDILLADGLANYRYAYDTLKKFDTSVVLYQQIAKAHGTTQGQLQKSLQFYEGRPDLLKLIFDSLQKRSAIPVRDSKKDTLQKLVD